VPKRHPFTVHDGCTAGTHLPSRSKITALQLDIFDKRLDFKIAAAGTARLADIVPPARIICDKIVDTAIQQIRCSGNYIPCIKGCSACCSYLISLSAPEV